MSELLKLLRNAGVIVLSLFTAFGMGFFQRSIFRGFIGEKEVSIQRLHKEREAITVSLIFFLIRKELSNYAY